MWQVTSLDMFIRTFITEFTEVMYLPQTDSRFLSSPGRHHPLCRRQRQRREHSFSGGLDSGSKTHSCEEGAAWGAVTSQSSRHGGNHQTLLPSHQFGLDVDFTSGLIPSRYRLLVLLKLTMLKITRWAGETWAKHDNVEDHPLGRRDMS